MITKISYQEKLKSFLKSIPFALGLKFPKLNGRMAVMIYECDLEDKEFLSEFAATPIDRATLAIPLIGNDEYDKTNHQYQKYILILQYIIARHRQQNHKENHSMFIAEAENRLSHESLSDEEKDLISDAAIMGIWQ